MKMNIMLELRIFLPALLFVSTVVLGHVNHTHVQKAEYLKQKWTMENVMRDIDHIKEDLASIMELTDVGQLTENEMAFYIIRMHDFDDNGKLDGHEIRAASEHSLEHMKGVPSHLKESEMEKLIDDALKMDMNLDGFIDFGELIQSPSTS